MRRIIVLSPALLMVASMSTIAIAGDVEPGLQVGDAAGAFKVKDVTGPRKGETLCYR